MNEILGELEELLANIVCVIEVLAGSEGLIRGVDLRTPPGFSSGQSYCAKSRGYMVDRMRWERRWWTGAVVMEKRPEERPGRQRKGTEARLNGVERQGLQDVWRRSPAARPRGGVRFGEEHAEACGEKTRERSPERPRGDSGVWRYSWRFVEDKWWWPVEKGSGGARSEAEEEK